MTARSLAAAIGRHVRSLRSAVTTAAGRLASAESRHRWLERLPGNRFALAGLVALAMVALYGVASVARPAPPAPRRPAIAPITAATAVCPAQKGATISAATPPGARGPGRMQMPGTQAPPASPGRPWSTVVKKTPGAGMWTVRAAGSLAAGLTVEQTSDDHGLAGLRCPAPASDLWFVGPGPADAEDVELFLTNVDGGPVSADLDGLSANGAIENVGGEGITVPPYSSQVIRIGQDPLLDPAAVNTKLIALHLQVGSGRLSAAVRVRRTKGADWLPATSPATRMLIPGVPPGKGRRRLLIAVPGNDQATVRIQAVSSDGTRIGQDSILAAALAVTPFNLGLGGKPAGVRVISDRPVVAALVAEQGADFAVTSAVSPLAASAGGVPSGGMVADTRDRTTLLLTAPDRPAVVRLTQLAAQVTAQDVRVPAGRTVDVTLPRPPGDRAVAIDPRPGSGPVYAARLLTINGGSTLLPVEPARVAVALPDVRDVLPP